MRPFQPLNDDSFSVSESLLTATSSSTVWGPGALSGKALKAFGERSLDLVCHVSIRMRLAKIKRAIENTPHVFYDPMDAIESQRLDEYHSDLKELCKVKYSLSVRCAAGDIIRKITLIQRPERPDPSCSSVGHTLSQWEVLLAPLLAPGGVLFLEEVNPSSFRPDLGGLHSESLGDRNQINNGLRAAGGPQEDRPGNVNPSSFRPHSLRGLHPESEGHTEWVTSVAFSHDDKRIVSGSRDMTIRVRNADTRELILAPFEGHTDWVTSVAFSHDDKLIVSGSGDKMILVWSADTGELISAPFEGHIDCVTSVAFSHDDKLIVSGSGDKTIRVWSADTGELILAPLEGHTDWVTSMAFSHDGKQIVSGSFDKTICVWNADTGELISPPFEGHTGGVTSVAFSHDGKRIVSGSFDKTIRVWNADTGEVISGPFEGHTDRVTSVAFSHDGKRIVSGSFDKTI
ncbi:WD40-repeat-containing domain protein, partial [Gautieria morchelliformis]